MTILWDLSCCVEYCGARGKCCIKHGERHVFPNYQQGRFPAPPQDNTRGKCSSLANETAFSRKCKKDHDFFLLSRLKAFSPAEAVLPGFGHPPQHAWSPSTVASHATPADTSAKEMFRLRETATLAKAWEQELKANKWDFRPFFSL